MMSFPMISRCCWDFALVFGIQATSTRIHANSCDAAKSPATPKNIQANSCDVAGQVLAHSKNIQEHSCDFVRTSSNIEEHQSKFM